MITFILAVVFWPITLLYYFIIYVVPFLFKALLILAYGAWYFVSENPVISISMAILTVLYFSWKDNKVSMDVITIKDQPIIEPNKIIVHQQEEDDLYETKAAKVEDVRSVTDSVFINRKKEVIELLQKMDGPDKKKLFANLRLRNPSLARELTESCLSFECIWDLDKEGLRNIVVKTKPAILGLALSLVSESKQFRALSLLSEDVAVRAFEIMQKDLTSYRSECFRAQQKILELAISLQRKRVIQFY